MWLRPFLSNATHASLSDTKCHPQAAMCPLDNTVSGSISPEWIARSILSVTSNPTYCVSVTFLSCDGCSWLKLCGRRSHAPIILLPHRLVRWLAKLPVEECRPRPITPLALCVSPATHFSTSFHSASTSSPSHVDIAPPLFSSQHQTVPREHFISSSSCGTERYRHSISICSNGSLPFQ